MQNEIINQKMGIVAYCVARIQQEYSETSALNNCTQLEAILLNIQHACKTIIDLALYIIRSKKLGIPENYSEIFSTLEKNDFIPSYLSLRLQNLINFCQHHLYNLNAKKIEIVDWIVSKQISNLVSFTNYIAKME